MATILIERIDGDRAFFSQAELHHLIRVRRFRAGDRFEAVTEDGRRLSCVLCQDGSDWYGSIEREQGQAHESSLELILAPALIKKDKFEWILQKATELGVSEIVPTVTQRTEIRLDEGRAEKKLVRWQRILIEAVKQCGRSHIPGIRAPQRLSDVLEQFGQCEKIAFDESGDVGLSEVVSEIQGSRLMVLIGPEGGWDERDRARFERAGVKRVKVGPRVLRAETAAIVALSVLQFTCGDLSGSDPSD